MINSALNSLVFVLGTALVGIAVFMDQSGGFPREQAQDSIKLNVIETFLADSRKHLRL
jgi:hypothetical protein